MDAGIKLAVFGVVALAFLIGGLSGFAGALTALIFLIVVVAVAGLAGFLLLKSRLMPRKKAGLLLVIAASLTAWFWSGARAPRQWPEERATVASVRGPTAITETDYSYRPDESKKSAVWSITQTKSWAKLSQAKGYRAGPATVYFNRANPSEVRSEPTNGWARASASPGFA